VVIQLGGIMLPALAAGSAALSLLGGLEQNAQIRKTATAQYNANKAFIERDSQVIATSLLAQGLEINQGIGMALSELGLQERQATGMQTATRAETGIYGNTAMRQQAVLETKAALQADNIIQAGEAKMTELQAKLSENKYATESKHLQNAQSYNNMMSQQQSTFSLLTGAASAGMSTYFAGGGKI
jgi:hypothetical protein